MRKSKEILRLTYMERLGQRDIAQSTGVSKSTVQDILTRAKAAELNDWNAIKGLREPFLVEKLFPSLGVNSSRKPDPDWARVREELMRKGVTLSLLWMDYRQENPDGLQYSRFCGRFAVWEKRSRLVMRQHNIAGQKLFVDYSGVTLPWTDLSTGEVHKAEIFVAVLGASNFTFVCATPDQKLPSWLGAHVDALNELGGTPEMIVPDNLKSGVTRACRYDPETNISYQSLAEHYGIAVVPARERKPKDKAKAEVGVQIVQRWILACLRNHVFHSVAEMNTAIKPLLAQLNDKTMRHLGASRRELFERYERAALRPLPEVAFEIPTWRIASVNIDYHVEIQRHYYSVPFRYVGRRVETKLTRFLVEVFYESESIARHQRRPLGPPGKHTTVPEHMPPAHMAMLAWIPERIIKWARDTGPKTSDFCTKILSSRAHPEQGFRACLGVLRLSKTYSSQRLENACAIALRMNSPRYKTVEGILKAGRDGEKCTSREEPATKIIETHENIRGPRYYN